LFEDARDTLRIAFKGLVSHMVDRLGYEEEGKRAGKKKRFDDSMVAKLDDFLKTFEARNLTNDTELKSLVSQARSIMKGVTPKQLRDLDNVRDSVASQFEKLKKDLDKNIVVKSTRKFAWANKDGE